MKGMSLVLTAIMLSGVTAMVGCQKEGAADQAIASKDERPAQEGASTPQSAQAVAIPETGLTDIKDTATCLAVFGAVMKRQGGENATEAQGILAKAVDPAAFKQLKDEFARKDKISALAPQIDAMTSPFASAEFFTITIDQKASPRLEIAQRYDSAGPGFRDGSTYLAGGEIAPSEFGGVTVSGTGGRESSTIEFRTMDQSGVRTCNLVFNFQDDWNHWFIVPDEGQAREVEAARANQTLKLRFDGLIKAARVESMPAIDSHIPYLETEVVRVHLVDDQGKILASPKPAKPATGT